MLKKILCLFIIAISASLIAGIYGILHDQISYTVSPEYYTKFKFIQFNLANENNIEKIKNPRILVSIVGFLATWWFGLILGFILGLTTLRQKNCKNRYLISLKSILFVLIITLITGIIGLLFGYLYLGNLPKIEFTNWFIPNNVINFRNFVAVGSLHNFSYIGGILGLILAMILNLKNQNKL